MAMRGILLLTLSMLVSIHGVPLSEFFPYGTGVNDLIFPANDDGSTNALPLPGIFPYFDNNHRQIYLANNGLFSFLGPISTFVPDPFPLGDGRRLVAGFWSDIDTRGNIPSGNTVYYQIHGTQSGRVLFDKATAYVRAYFPSERAFSPSMVITGTWYRVGAFPAQTNRTNTFQIVLATDEIRSFAFLLYYDLQWASPGSNGVGGQAGFNAGDGLVFQMLPNSRTSNVTLLASTSNVNVPGLFVYRIDTDTIGSGGCGNRQNAFRPRRGSQLGSTAVTIRGPCFNNITSSMVKCRFGNSTVVDGLVINDLKATCLTPMVALPSTVEIYLSTDQGNSFALLPGTFTFTAAEYGMSTIDNAEVEVRNVANAYLTAGDQLTLGWFLSDATMNDWIGLSMQLEVLMYTVSLNTTTGEVAGVSSTVLRQSIIPRAGYQSISITVPASSNTNFGTAFFRVVARNIQTNVIHAGLNSALFVTNVNAPVASNYCQAWITRQPEASTWNGDLLLCPLTLVQARVARCCYEPDPTCLENSNNNSDFNCLLRRGDSRYQERSAVACYRSRGTNQWNAGAECCYDQTGQLITYGSGSGTDDRYQPATSPLLHFVDDTMPFLACCLMSGDRDSCTRYFELRPSRRGSNTRNAWGGSWGDPHFTTLDGAAYTFNGYGEYTYLAIASSPVSSTATFDSVVRSLAFHAQIRTTPITVSNGTLTNDATVIRGFAAQNISVTVSRREFLVVRRGNETISFDGTSDDTISASNSTVLSFPELTIERNRTSGVMTLSWFIGVAIQITPITVSAALSNVLVLNVAVSVASAHRNRTFGLLGSYDNDPSNDIRARNGSLIGSADALSAEQIHRQFGQTWAIDPLQSLFYYEAGDAASLYASRNSLYVPSFAFPQPSSTERDSILTTCSIDRSVTNQTAWTVAQRTCYYDMAVTHDASLGRMSRAAAETVVQTVNAQRSPPEFNANLPLALTVNRSTPIALDFTAMSPYSAGVVYTLLQGPNNATFDNQTGLFRWHSASATSNETVVRVSAEDNRYRLRSTHEISIRIGEPRVETTTAQSAVKPSHGTRVDGSVLSIISLLAVFLVRMMCP